MITLGTIFSSTAFFTSGGSKTKKLAQGPPINASSVEEESFIKYELFIRFPIILYVLILTI